MAGCGAADPTAPRPARTVTPAAAAPEQVPREQERGSPTRGLACTIQRGAMRLCGASTDNYKATFNADPTAPEPRTWLAIHELELHGQRYRAAEGQPLQPEAVRMEAIDGGAEVEVVADVLDGPATVGLRVGPQQGLWGPLLRLDDEQVRDDAPIVVELRVQGDGAEAAAVRVTYVRDEQLADASPDSLEHGGPGGRWLVDGTPTATNLELGWE